MSDGRVQEASGSPPRPPKRLGVALWLGLVTSVTMAVVLLANDGRNLKLVMHRIGIDFWIRSSDPPGQEVQQVPRAPSRSWPLAVPADERPDPIIDFRLPEQRCLSLAVADQDPPTFSTESGGTWQCVMFWVMSREEDAPSVFIQIRGNDQGEITAWRAKFSKGQSDGTVMAHQSLEILKKALQPLGLSEELLSMLEAKINGWQEFYYYMGNQRLSFRPEFSDPRRFNLLAQRRRLPDFVPMPPSDVRHRQGQGDRLRGAVDPEKSVKGPRP
ncbi:hypothetical protein J2858_000863 [Neorhizobium galegae]|uniref:DUF6030 family protein n=1 Tax=Neorhizobium galegae TaxID=399 RepID=UPI001AE600DD|nr:DUF6030 family protein [Neorhizobium galegae]MBP2547970.1 hypothetical protein [Neorhizobium galegae]